MDKYLIGANAGIVWHVLSSNQSKKWTYSELKEASGLSHYELCTAIGWLAREDKIQIDQNLIPAETDGDKFYLLFNVYL